MSTGINRVRAATLFINADSTPPIAPIMVICAPKLHDASTNVRVIK